MRPEEAKERLFETTGWRGRDQIRPKQGRYYGYKLNYKFVRLFPLTNKTYVLV